jgi:hypothetical protein
MHEAISHVCDSANDTYPLVREDEETVATASELRHVIALGSCPFITAAKETYHMGLLKELIANTLIFSPFAYDLSQSGSGNRLAL